MSKYAVLMRGINVGGKNKISMTDLRECLEKLGFSNVSTYIASGNILLESNKSPTDIQSLIEQTLPKQFKLDSELIKVLVLSSRQLQTIIDRKPAEFGEQPDKFHSDVIFLMDISLNDAMPVFKPREGVDRIWPGHAVIYSERLSAMRTKSRLSTIVSTPAYQSMTIRSWSTTTKLFQLLHGLGRK